MTKSWQEKLNCGKEPQIKKVDKAFWGLEPGDKLLVSSPQALKAFIDKIPAGQFMPMGELRIQLAKDAKAKLCCPVSTGIFLRIIAEATHEAYQSGSPLGELCPIWRVLSPSTSTTKKLSFDPSYLWQQQLSENIHAL